MAFGSWALGRIVCVQTGINEHQNGEYYYHIIQSNCTYCVIDSLDMVCWWTAWLIVLGTFVLLTIYSKHHQHEHGENCSWYNVH